MSEEISNLGVGTALVGVEIPQAAPIDPGYSAFVQNQRIINQVVFEMREEVPANDASLVPQEDTKLLRRVEFPVSGGIHTYMDSMEFPYKGFPYFEFVDKMDTLKKIAKNLLSGLYHRLKGKSKLWLPLLIPSTWFFKILVHTGIYIFYRIFYRYRLKSIRYCDAVREIYRAFNYKSGNKKVDELSEMVRDVVCMILEFDNAYRYRFQDVAEEISSNNGDVIAELVHLLDTLAERERTQTPKDTWLLIKTFLPWYLRLDKTLKVVLENTLRQIDTKKIYLDKFDKEYCSKRKDYIFGFMSRGEVPIPEIITKV